MELLDTLDNEDTNSNIKLSIDDIKNLKDKKEGLMKILGV